MMPGVAVLEVRLAQPDDEPFQWDMGWEATAMDAGMRALGRDAALAIPQIRRYLDGWGRPGDTGVVAVPRTGSASALPGTASSRPRTRAGASWRSTCRNSRLASLPRRGAGASGARCSTRSWRLAREQGYRALSLSVDRQNPARRLYERKGFRDAGISDPTDTSVTMIAHL